MYYSNKTDANLQVLEPLLLETKVDLCLWFNRTCVEPVAPGEYDAPVHAVIGNAGQSLSSFPAVRATWSRYQASQFGYSTIEVNGKTQLVMRFFKDSDDSLDYQFTITRRADLY